MSESLVEAAREAMTRAYAPYSGYRVGAALETRDGTVIVGCNVENASYPAGICAERVALSAAVAQGHREFSALAICVEAGSPASPCGICRQVLAEFAPALPITSATTRGARQRWTLDALLPAPFTSAVLRDA
ncbi:MAG: cytidine deaminase [Gemmatimonadaceae bacterium]|jgi:cytidine deaminase|nr:cytidine deaminase [Gemmatimonadaceae bacterium]